MQVAAHDAAPAALNKFKGQGMQEELLGAPESGFAVPAGQREQVALDTAPTTDEYLPRAHDPLHKESASKYDDPYTPAGQGYLLKDPVPAGQ